MKKNEKSLKSVEDLKKLAEECGVADNPLFATTLERYETQIYILGELKKTIESEDVLVTKTYVKDRANIATHPAISEYNRTTDSANKTASTLMKIMKSFEIGGAGDGESDPLMDALNGGDIDE